MESEGKLSKIPKTSKERKVIHDMLVCGTEVLGMTKEVCEECGHTVLHYGSCNNSNCSQCGYKKSQKWAEKQKEKTVNAPYYHIVFTVPDKYLNPLFLYDRAFMLNSMFNASAETLRELSKDEKYLGVDIPGFISGVHTWSNTLSLHCHIHVIFCAAGLKKDGTLVKHDSEQKFLFPAKVLADLFKGKLMEKIEKKYLVSNGVFNADLEGARQKEWNVEIRRCEGGPQYVVKYLSRYVNRIAITNGRLISYENGKVKFRYKDNKDNGKLKAMEMEDEAFVERYLLHVAPERFIRMRYYGFFANNAREKLKEVQQKAGTAEQPLEEPKTDKYLNEDGMDEEVWEATHKCPKCQGRLVTLESKCRIAGRASQREALEKMIKQRRAAKFLQSG